MASHCTDHESNDNSHDLASASFSDFILYFPPSAHYPPSHTGLFINIASCLFFVDFSLTVSSAGNTFLLQLHLVGHFSANKAQLKGHVSENFPGPIS